MDHKILRIFSLCIIFQLAFLTARPAYNQVLKDPRAVGMAGAYTAVARDFYAVGYNPANLAVLKRNIFTVQILGLSAGVSNSSITLNDYNRYTGADLEKDGMKEELLNSIPENGVTLFFTGNLSPILLNFSTANFAFTTNVLSYGEITIPKAPFEILFQGNEIGKDFEISAGGEAIGVGEAAASFSAVFLRFLIGTSLKYLYGFSYAIVDSSEGNFKTDSTYITGEGDYKIKRSSGGSGYAVDVGILYLTATGWKIGVSVSNLFGKITWTKGNVINHFYYDIENLNLNKLSTRGFESLVKGGNEEEKGVGKFSTTYPGILRVGVAKEYKNYLIAFDYTKGFEDRLFSTTKPRFALGMEYHPYIWIPLRIGFAIGGKHGRELAFGMGYETRLLMIDFAYSNIGGIWFGSSRGFEISLGIAFRILK
ncbi:MAG: DUF5723 family protein [Fidelibacterota bacterium]